MLTSASLGIRHVPRGDKFMDPTFGPSGIADLLNCCEKKLMKKIFSHFKISSNEYFEIMRENEVEFYDSTKMIEGLDIDLLDSEIDLKNDIDKGIVEAVPFLFTNKSQI